MPEAEKVPSGDNERFVLSGQQVVKFEDPPAAAPEYTSNEEQPSFGGQSRAFEDHPPDQTGGNEHEARRGSVKSGAEGSEGNYSEEPHSDTEA